MQWCSISTAVGVSRGRRRRTRTNRRRRGDGPRARQNVSSEQVPAVRTRATAVPSTVQSVAVAFPVPVFGTWSVRGALTMCPCVRSYNNNNHPVVRCNNISRLSHVLAVSGFPDGPIYYSRISSSSPRSASRGLFSVRWRRTVSFCSRNVVSYSRPPPPKLVPLLLHTVCATRRGDLVT